MTKLLLSPGPQAWPELVSSQPHPCQRLGSSVFVPAYMWLEEGGGRPAVARELAYPGAPGASMRCDRWHCRQTVLAHHEEVLSNSGNRLWFDQCCVCLCVWLWPGPEWVLGKCLLNDDADVSLRNVGNLVTGGIQAKAALVRGWGAEPLRSFPARRPLGSMIQIKIMVTYYVFFFCYHDTCGASDSLGKERGVHVWTCTCSHTPTHSAATLQLSCVDGYYRWAESLKSSSSNMSPSNLQTLRI